ncbi:alpha-mannosidase [Caldicellulosiruptoraceae bacterium PP1]
MYFFTLEKIQRYLPEIKDSIYKKVYDIKDFKYIEKDIKDARYPDFNHSDFYDFKVGSFWGGYDIIAWFRTTVAIPKDFRDGKLALRFLCGPRDGGESTAEALLFIDGDPVQAIDIWHEEAVIPQKYIVNKDEIFIALRVWSGVLGVPDRRRFKLAQLICIDETTEKFYHMVDVVSKTISILPESDIRRHKYIEIIENTFKLIKFNEYKSQEYYKSIKNAYNYLKENLNEFSKVNEHKPKVIGIGHSHIDMAWLWRLQHSKEKASRTFSTVLNLMAQYPDYKFMHSSPQLYKFLKQDYPEIFEKVKEKINSKQWEITGGMWVEADTNIPSGESLIRQFLFGKRFIKKEFNKDTFVLWLPDVFGYSWALPQIIIGCGLKYFITSKISWNQFNRFPYDTFMWRGIDGTEVLTHFITTPEVGSKIYTYNGVVEPYTVKGIWDNYKQKDINSELLLTFGWGDGGGGPTKEMIENGMILKNIPGVPQFEFGHVEPYMERLNDTLMNKDVPVWDGELYLEFHRGTYTSQGIIKRLNRKAEILYHNAEFLSSLSFVYDNNKYPQEDLNKGWELILLNQFHDIIPGSSIRQVYDDTKKDFEVVNNIGNNAVNDAINNIVNLIDAKPNTIVVVNPTSWTRTEIVQIDCSTEKNIIDDKNNKCISESVDNKLLFIAEEIPPYGYKTFEIIDKKYQELGSKINVSVNEIDNKYYTIKFDDNGHIVSLFDKENNREIISKGRKGNIMQVFEDKPQAFDAWDIDIFYQQKMNEVTELLERKVLFNGFTKGVLYFKWRYYESIVEQKVIVYNHTRRIDFETTVDWKQKQELLKVLFPVDIRTNKATYEIQYGTIERPTHWNTSWDIAKFEVPAQRWADLSEGNYGISLLNDCKYGYDIKDNNIRLTLIKSPVKPDETADRCIHNFTYSIYPHKGSWNQSDVIKEADFLNNQVIVTFKENNGGILPTTFSFISVDNKNIIIDTIKKAEDDNALIIRAYESKQTRGYATFTLAKEIKQCFEVNFVEEEPKPIEFSNNSFVAYFEPYKIKTFKIYL